LSTCNQLKLDDVAADLQCQPGWAMRRAARDLLSASALPLDIRCSACQAADAEQVDLLAMLKAQHLHPPQTLH